MPNLSYFKEQCIANRALWQARYDTLKELAGDPAPITRAPLTDQRVHMDALPQDRYRTLFPLSIPASLLDDEASPNVPIQSAPTSIASYSNSPSTVSLPYSPTYSESTTSAQKPKSANSEVRALRAAYQASFRQHSSHSFRNQSSNPGTKESFFSRDLTQ
ncbi:hypothetical protein QFC22_002859 [Naganishia vaughanmartiniae]|uniref:Uncharacterized protein n=1 Tax=Naganishia vaughanmartiniae TaxID=1424756 RepID=A0ACC2XA75_9TREE|nr:hypothetical protein QFC22_002859 [Naganishia vaughanmartiniae]